MADNPETVIAFNTPWVNGSLLVKFGKKEHLFQLQKEGIVYCNSIKWFAGLKDERLRGDEYEAVIRTQYMEKSVFQLREADDPNSQWKKLNVNQAQFKEFHKEPLGNLFVFQTLNSISIPIKVSCKLIKKNFSLLEIPFSLFSINLHS